MVLTKKILRTLKRAADKFFGKKSDELFLYRADHWTYNWRLLFNEMGISSLRVTRLSDKLWEGEWAKHGCIVEAML